MYRPLPHNMVIKSSTIEGVGLFTDEPINPDTVLGFSHKIGKEEEIVELPLGGFINHSLSPNCIIVPADKHGKFTGYSLKSDVYGYLLISIKKILKGEEITVNYKYSACGCKYENLEFDENRDM